MQWFWVDFTTKAQNHLYFSFVPPFCMFLYNIQALFSDSLSFCLSVLKLNPFLSLFMSNIVCLSPPFCFSVCLFVLLSKLSIYFSFCHLFVFLPKLCQNVKISFCLSFCLSICLSFHTSVVFWVFLSIFFSVFLSFYLSSFLWLFDPSSACFQSCMKWIWDFCKR